MSETEQRNFIIDVKNAIRKEQYWKEYSEIKFLKYQSIQDYFKKVIQPQIYYRSNEGVNFRDFESWVMIRCWSETFHQYTEFYEDLIKTMKYFIEDFKQFFPWTWRIHVIRYPFINLVYRFTKI